MTKEQFNNNASTNENIDVAFLCLKELNNKLHWHKNLIQNAQPLPEIKASLSEELSAGKFLLSHPLLSGFFSRSVIALTEVNEEEVRCCEERSDKLGVLVFSCDIATSFF